MLDRLLGRADLKERIAELEEDRRHLERELDAESDRRAEAVRDRQAAEERANRLEDRVAELEDRVERAGSEGQSVAVRRRETVTDQRLRALLDRLESVAGGSDGAFSAYLPDGNLPPAVREAFGDRAALVRRAAPCVAYTDDAALVSACLRPPVAPESFTQWDDEFAVDRAWFEPTGHHAVALVRSDLFAMGEYRGRERVAFHGFTGDLTAQHSKGGFSQARFERLRDEQIDTHLERCRAAMDERDAETLYVVGEATLLGEFADVANATATVDATGKPEPALADAVHDFWSVPVWAV